MNMKRLYVKIMRCSDQGVWWYSNYIGKVIEVTQAVEGEEYWKATRIDKVKKTSNSVWCSTGIDMKFLIYKKDCVVHKGIRAIRCL